MQVKAQAATPEKTWNEHYVKNIKRVIYQQSKKLAATEKVWETMQKKLTQSVHVAHYVAVQQLKPDLEENDKQWYKKHGSHAELQKKKLAQPMLLLQQLQVESLHHYINGAKMLLEQFETNE